MLPAVTHIDRKQESRTDKPAEPVFITSRHPLAFNTDPDTRTSLAKLLNISDQTLHAPYDYEAKVLRIGPHTISILIPAATTNNQLSCLGMSHPRNFSPPEHIHYNDNETFLIRTGRYLFKVGDKFHVLTKGQAILVPKGIAHTFKCLSERGRTLVFSTSDTLENYFIEVSKLPAEDFVKSLKVVNTRYGTEFVGRSLNKIEMFW